MAKKTKADAEPEAETGSWVVRVRCVVTKELICENCTREQAESNPYDHAANETEIEQYDYEVQSVHPNR